MQDLIHILGIYWTFLYVIGFRGIIWRFWWWAENYNCGKKSRTI
jgi:hypothetical protein